MGGGRSPQGWAGSGRRSSDTGRDSEAERASVERHSRAAAAASLRPQRRDPERRSKLAAPVGELLAEVPERRRRSAGLVELDLVDLLERANPERVRHLALQLADAREQLPDDGLGTLDAQPVASGVRPPYEH